MITIVSSDKLQKFPPYCDFKIKHTHEHTETPRECKNEISAPTNCSIMTERSKFLVPKCQVTYSSVCSQKYAKKEKKNRRINVWFRSCKYRISRNR